MTLILLARDDRDQVRTFVNVERICAGNGEALSTSTAEYQPTQLDAVLGCVRVNLTSAITDEVHAVVAHQKPGDL